MDDSAFQSLPLYESAGAIRAEIAKGENLLLTAPTGSGKSTLVPWLLASEKNGTAKVAVLEPRRLAATSLSGYLAKLSRAPEGSTVGYKIRFESSVSDKTQILFTTYGNFLQSELHKPEAFDWIVFDEFHERRADMDLLLAYFLAKQKSAKSLGISAPKIAVLSAELNREELEKILQVPCLKVGRPGFPVQILNQDSPAGTPLAKNVEKALRTLERNGVWGTTLVFLPGKGEISTVHRHLDEAYGYGKLKVYDLYGGQEKSVEREIFATTGAPRVILSTNIAETSLTIPSVTGVIDSGLERTTEFNAQQSKNLLKLSRISLQNAVQRTGRAGRTQKGVCIRLWSSREEALFPKGIVPEVQKSDLRPILLERAALSKKAGVLPTDLHLPTEPDSRLSAKALEELIAYHFLNADGTVTDLGEKALDVPLNDLALAKAYLEASAISSEILALFAILDNEESSGKDRTPQNALELAEDLLRKGNRTTRETRLAFKRLAEHAKEKDASRFANSDATIQTFLKAFPEALAIQSGSAYKTPTDTFPIAPSTVQEAKAILVFHLLRTSSAQKSEMRASLYIPVPEKFLQSDQAKARYELLWRSGQERYIGLEIREANGVEVSRKEIQPQEASPQILQKLKSLTAQTWMERHKREDLSHLWMDDANKILLCKMKLAAINFPEYSLPEWSKEDMDIVVEDFMDGIFLMRDLSADRFRKKMKEYFGENMIGWMEKMFPDTLVLPNGKKARYRYEEDSPVEISARIEDFMQMRGEHTIAQGKIKVRYDILAPNFRTAQKTWDLTGFWKNTYPQIRKELRGRYPKHPWPETVIPQ
ncbi:MAG: ATP-dependent RNA helicase [Fibrobacter sp.]|nr:ATP-dependent RNA helicase [Fibrobacter sp.]